MVCKKGQTCLAGMTLGSCAYLVSHAQHTLASVSARRSSGVSGVAPSSPQLLVPLSAPSSLRRKAGAAEPSLRDPGGHRVGATAHAGGLLLAPPLLLRAHRHLLGVPEGGEWNTLNSLGRPEASSWGHGEILSSSGGAPGCVGATRALEGPRRADGALPSSRAAGAFHRLGRAARGRA